MGANALLVAAGSIIALKFRELKQAAFVGGIGLCIIVIIISIVLFLKPDHFLYYELLLLPMLFCLGIAFTVGNTLSMDEGRSMAGDASAVLGIVGYIFGAVVSPLVGKGNIMHSTAIAYLIIMVVVVVSAFITRKLAVDNDGL